MVKENYPEIYNANKGIHLTSDKMSIGLSPEVCHYMSMKLNEAGHTVVGDTSMHKLLNLRRCFESWYADQDATRPGFRALPQIRVVKEFKKSEVLQVELEKIGIKDEKSSEFSNLIDLCSRPQRVFEPLEQISEAYRHVDLGVRGWDEARTKLRDLFVYCEQELDRVKRLNCGKQLTQKEVRKVYEAIRKPINAILDNKKYGFGKDRAHFRVALMEDVGFGPHAPWLDEPSLAKQSDSADLPVGQMYLVVGLLIQGEHSVTPSLYELVNDIKHAGDNGPMAVTHTNAEWLAMIETWRFRDLLRRASIKVMNAIDTAKGREAIQLLTPDEPARNWGKYLSDHIIDWDVEDKVSDEQAAARLDAITKFRAKVDDLGPTGFPRKFQDLFKGAHRSGPLMVLLTPPARWGDMKSADCLTPLPVREHIAATNTTIRSEAYRIKNQMPDLVISFTEFALLACAPELIAVSAPNVSHEWISMKVTKILCNHKCSSEFSL